MMDNLKLKAMEVGWHVIELYGEGVSYVLSSPDGNWWEGFATEEAAWSYLPEVMQTYAQRTSGAGEGE